MIRFCFALLAVLALVVPAQAHHGARGGAVVVQQRVVPNRATIFNRRDVVVKERVAAPVRTVRAVHHDDVIVRSVRSVPRYVESRDVVFDDHFQQRDVIVEREVVVPRAGCRSLYR